MNAVAPLAQIMQSSFPHLSKSQGQHIQSAMNEPCPGKTTFVIMVSPLPGEYHLSFLFPNSIKAEPAMASPFCKYPSQQEGFPSYIQPSKVSGLPLSTNSEVYPFPTLHMATG